MTTKRILVVDDSAIELKLTARILAQAGYDVLTATSGPQALALARESSPDLMLLDLNMPQMDGYDVCRKLKQDEATRAIPVILYTVRDQFVDVLRGLEVGAEDFIPKGTKREEMLARLQRVLQGPSHCKIPPLDLSSLEEMLAHPEAEPIARLLDEAFHHHVRSCLNQLFGVHPTFLLVERALRRAAERAPLLAHSDQGTSGTTLFDPHRVSSASTADVIEAFKIFASELLLVTAKLANTRLYGLRELDELTRAFKRLLADVAEQRRSLLSGPPPGAAKAPPLAESSPLAEAPATFTFFLDAEGRVQNLDEGMAKALGYEKAALVGAPMTSLLPESAHKALQMLLREVQTRGEAQGTLTLRRRDGTLLSVALSSHALFDKQGNFVLSQHQAERLVEDTEPEERMRLLKRECDRLREALRRTEQDQETLLHIISHDLRQPLQIILNAAQLLEEEAGGTLSEPLCDYLSTIESAALRLRDMIGDLVKLLGIRADTLRREPTDVKRLLEELCQALTPLLEQRNAVVTLTGHLPIVLADSASLRLVFFHLIENALTFNDKPRPIIDVGGLPPSDGAHIFYVRDNGIGIESKHWERIFHAFQRLHAEDAFPGRGMGLAFCKRIIEAHGGRIWVESTPGVGSTFSFTLPMAGGDQIAEDPPSGGVLQKSAEVLPAREVTEPSPERERSPHTSPSTSDRETVRPVVSTSRINAVADTPFRSKTATNSSPILRKLLDAMAMTVGPAPLKATPIKPSTSRICRTSERPGTRLCRYGWCTRSRMASRTSSNRR